MFFISADPPEISRRFREQLGLTFPLLSDQEHRTADHYGIPISRVDPRAWFYPNGFIQPAVVAYDRDLEVFRWIQRPSVLNLGGASLRPRPEKVLRAVRRAVR